MPGGPGYPGGLPTLTDDGATVVFCVRDRGCTHVYAAAADGSGTPKPVVGRLRPGRIRALGVAGAGPGGTAAVALATPDSYGEIVVVDLASGAETVITTHGAGQGEVELYARQEREFTISDGTTVPGWLIRDPDAAGPGPLLLDIHGGPHNAWNGAADPAHLYHQELAARGWTVLLLNPRASDGYGEAFYTATVGAWGAADAADFLEPLDQLVAEGIADPARLAVTGYSYGGYMTCYLTSRDGRFAAAVPGGAVSDLTSMIGTSDEGNALAAWEFGLPFPLAADGAALAAMSPFTRVARRDDPDAAAARRRRHPLPGRPGRAVAHRAAAARRATSSSCGTRARRTCSSSTARRPIESTTTSGWWTGWSSTQARPSGRRSTAPTGSGASRCSPSGTRSPARPSASCGSAGDGRPDEVIEAAYGYANFPAKIEATTDTLFQIGSISKVWTATLAMQLVDEGMLDLDAPVAEVLPELRLADREVAKTVTMRHLLDHTSGIDGDVFTDTGRGDDCVEKYVALLSRAEAEPPAGRHLVLLQRRLRAGRAG